jgi:hypothetical protein
MTIFVNKGDAPLTPVQLEKRAQTYIRRSWPEQAREKSIRKADGLFDAFMATFSANHAINVENNTFNWQLAEYHKATARLAKYRLADGKPEETIETPTGQYDEEGNEIMDVTVIPAIEPLDAEVEENVYDEEGNLTGIIMVDNPLIVADDQERAAAQAVVDSTPEEVKGFN